MPDEDAGPPPVDLFAGGDGIAAVSSVGTGSIARALMDGNTATAWRSSRDDWSPWVAFRVPADAWVKYVTLRSTSDAGAGTLKEVEVTRNGDVIDISLDTEEGGWRIDINAAGGDFTIQAVAFDGSNELAIAEMAVFGVIGAAKRRDGGAMIVRTGALDEKPSLPSTYEAACKRYLQSDRIAANGQWIARGGERRDDPGECQSPSKKLAGKNAIFEVAHVPVKTAWKEMQKGRFDGELLAIRTAEGVTITDVRVAGKETHYAYELSQKLISETWVGDQLVVEVAERYIVDDEGGHRETNRVQRTTCDATTATCRTVEKK